MQQPQPPQKDQHTDRAHQKHTDALQSHPVGQHLKQWGDRPRQDTVEFTRKDHARHLPYPLEQYAAKPFRNKEKRQDQIDLVLFPARDIGNIAVDDKGRRHAHHAAQHARQNHHPEIRRIFHFRLDILRLHAQKNPDHRFLSSLFPVLLSPDT